MTAAAEYSTIITEQIGMVLRITMNRPEKRNALSFDLQEELTDAIEAAGRGDAVRCIIIRGAGVAFSAGYDLTPRTGQYSGESTVEQDVANMLALGERWSKVWNCRIPVIAQLHGYCLAGGTDLALHCDMVICADDATIGIPPVRSMGGPPTHMWVYNLGPQWTKRMFLTGDSITGKQAAEIGMAMQSVPPDELDDHVLELATRIALIGKSLLAHNKRIVNLAIEMMGRTPMQTMAAVHDALGHLAPETARFKEVAAAQGVRAAIADRDAPFV